MEAVGGTRLDQRAEQRCVGGVGRERADGDRGGGVEPVVPHDHDRAWLARVGAAGRGPDLAALHASQGAAMASAKA